MTTSQIRLCISYKIDKSRKEQITRNPLHYDDISRGATGTNTGVGRSPRLSQINE